MRNGKADHRAIAPNSQQAPIVVQYQVSRKARNASFKTNGARPFPRSLIVNAPLDLHSPLVLALNEHRVARSRAS